MAARPRSRVRVFESAEAAMTFLASTYETPTGMVAPQAFRAFAPSPVSEFEDAVE